MIKNLKKLALLFVAAATMLTISCSKDDNNTPSTPSTPENPEPPAIMDLVGTSWKFHLEADIQGMELVMDDELNFISADSVHRVTGAVLMGQSAVDENVVAYLWDGDTLRLSMEEADEVPLIYREKDDVFFRNLDSSDPRTQQILQMLGVKELIYLRQ